MNIDKVCRQHLCTQCGACRGVCPKANIRVGRTRDMDYAFRVIDRRRCGSCGLCARVCPGIEVDFASLQDSLFPDVKPDRWFGCFSGSSLTRSTDPKIVRQGSSGGTVTGLLAFGLKTGRIDGAIVARMAEDRPWEPRAFIARTVEELHCAAGSKYCPAPMCMGLRDVMRTSGRFAMVGLPCHLHALRKAQALLPGLRERIVLAVGLYCGPGVSFLLMDCLLRRYGIARTDLQQLIYRDKNLSAGAWPGGFHVRTRSGKEVWLPLEDYYVLMSHLSLRRCQVCPDFGADLADLSTGDARPAALKDHSWVYTTPGGATLRGSEGWNATVVRTRVGAEWVEAARAAGELRVEPVPFDVIRRGAASSLYSKKCEFWARMRVRALMRRKLPRFTGLPTAAPMKGRDFVKPLITTVITELVRIGFVRRMLARLPWKLLWIRIGMRQRMIREAVAGPRAARKETGS